MSTENQPISQSEEQVIKRLLESNRPHEVKEIINHIETAYAVVKPRTSEVMCYCTSRDDAQIIASSLKMASDMALSLIVHKAFN